MKIRDDINDLLDGLAQLPPKRPASPYFAAKVVDLGAKPAAPNKFLAVIPQIIGGAEIEGAPVLIQDRPAAGVVEAAFLGGKVPDTGALVVAAAVPNRWATEGGKAIIAGLDCSPCAIPKEDLTISWVGDNGVSGSAVAHWNGSFWRTDCIVCTGEPMASRDQKMKLNLYCISEPNLTELTVTWLVFDISGPYPSTNCNMIAAESITTNLIDHVCSPYHIHYRVNNGGLLNLPLWGQPPNGGDIYVDGP